MSIRLHRLLPHPVLTVLLTIIWLLLVNSFSLNSLVMGLILGLLIPFATAAYWPERPRIRRPFAVFSYVLLVMWDILVANVVVAWTILTKRNDAMHPTWVSIPLDLKRPEAISILAGTITLTPGTVSADLSDQGNALLVHALDARDPDAVRDEIKERYERRLKEIFE
jgi:multicomponent K+:H+ antiporter subunit E